MPDVRDAVRSAIQRTLQSVENDASLVTKGFASRVHAAEAGIAQSAEAVELMKRAQAVLDQVEDGHVNGDLIHTEDPDLARLLSALDASVDPEHEVKARSGVIGWHKYDETDPHWLLTLVNELVRDKVPFIKPSKPTDFQVRLAEGDLTMAICGDWATGLMSSSEIVAAMLAHDPDLMIHLGDVYYSGTEEESRQKLLKRFRGGKQGAFTLNSNHEMYSGGHGYFNVSLKNPPFSAKQKASYFSAFNSRWQIIGLDSAYEADKRDKLYQHGWIGREQFEWFQYQLEDGANAKRKIIVMTHHNPVGINGDFDLKFLDQMVQAAKYHPFHYWYWGHEHDAAVYRVMNMGGNNVYGRCIGHGGIPYPPQLLGDKGSGVFVEWTETERYALGKGDPRCALNGFAVVRLPARGERLVEAWYDDSNRLRYGGQYPPATSAADVKLSVTQTPSATA